MCSCLFPLKTYYSLCDVIPILSINLSLIIIRVKCSIKCHADFRTSRCFLDYVTCNLCNICFDWKWNKWRVVSDFCSELHFNMRLIRSFASLFLSVLVCVCVFLRWFVISVRHIGQKKVTFLDVWHFFPSNKISISPILAQIHSHPSTETFISASFSHTHTSSVTALRYWGPANSSSTARTERSNLWHEILKTLPIVVLHCLQWYSFVSKKYKFTKIKRRTNKQKNNWTRAKNLFLRGWQQSKHSVPSVAKPSVCDVIQLSVRRECYQVLKRKSLMFLQGIPDVNVDTWFVSPAQFGSNMCGWGSLGGELGNCSSFSWLLQGRECTNTGFPQSAFMERASGFRSFLGQPPCRAWATDLGFPLLASMEITSGDLSYHSLPQ